MVNCPSIFAVATAGGDAGDDRVELAKYMWHRLGNIGMQNLRRAGRGLACTQSAGDLISRAMQRAAHPLSRGACGAEKQDAWTGFNSRASQRIPHQLALGASQPFLALL